MDERPPPEPFSSFSLSLFSLYISSFISSRSFLLTCPSLSFFPSFVPPFLSSLSRSVWSNDCVTFSTRSFTPDSKVHIHATCYFSRSEKCAALEKIVMCSLWFARSEFFHILFRAVRIWLRVIGANKREQPFENKTGFEQFVSWNIHEEFLAKRKSRFFCLFMIASNASSKKADLSIASVFSLVIRNVIGWNLITGRYLLGLPSWRKRVYGSIYGFVLSSVLKEII